MSISNPELVPIKDPKTLKSGLTLGDRPQNPAHHCRQLLGYTRTAYGQKPKSMRQRRKRSVLLQGVSSELSQ